MLPHEAMHWLQQQDREALKILEGLEPDVVARLRTVLNAMPTDDRPAVAELLTRAVAALIAEAPGALKPPVVVIDTSPADVTDPDYPDPFEGS